MTMFDVKGAKKVNLDGNITTGDKILKGRNIDELNGRNNIALGEGKSNKGLMNNIFYPAIAAILAALCIGMAVYFVPELKQFLK
ncbi:hypothetical protein [Comamonas sp. 26]|uniref:hypothetical protein n=1 Tax=Comamonas sp. 26 TaxID=2035201 RepID=UPI000C1A711D|nr:hypothetical protein [Comamonas sp. 26]PIG09925.1 hypothetical protein CLU84_2890 [Comamonas sp. 26]